MNGTNYLQIASSVNMCKNKVDTYLSKADYTYLVD